MARHYPDWIGLKLGVLWAAHRFGLPARLLHRTLLRGHVGDHLSAGRGSCLIGRKIRVGARLRLGRHSTVVADTIDIADDVTIGDNVTIRCRQLVLRNNSRIDSRTVVYGILTPNSGFDLGQHAWIYSDCHINTDHRVSIGDRSAAGSHTLIFSHSSYLPITHGYPVSIQPVEIGADVWLPWHVFVLPGARIGNGSTVGAFSLVAGEVPPNSLAVGVPARIVKDADHYRRSYSETEMRALVERIVGEAVGFAVNSFRPSSIFFPKSRTLERQEEGVWIILDGTESMTVVFAQACSAEQLATRRTPDRTLFVSIGEIDKLPPKASWIDPVSLRSSLSPSLAPVLSDVIEGLTSFGVRFGWMPDDLQPDPVP